MNNVKITGIVTLLLMTTACASSSYKSDNEADPFENFNRAVFNFNDSATKEI